MAMNIVCLDLEGVLVPEIWIAFAEADDMETWHPEGAWTWFERDSGDNRED